MPLRDDGRRGAFRAQPVCCRRSIVSSRSRDCRVVRPPRAVRAPFGISAGPSGIHAPLEFSAPWNSAPLVQALCPRYASAPRDAGVIHELWVSCSIPHSPASMSDRLRGTSSFSSSAPRLGAAATGTRSPAGCRTPARPPCVSKRVVVPGALSHGAAWLVQSDWRRSELDRPAKFYRLTAAGRRQLKKETSEWPRLRRRRGHHPGAEPMTHNDDDARRWPRSSARDDSSAGGSTSSTTSSRSTSRCARVS
jgi:hypothetical protein